MSNQTIKNDLKRSNWPKWFFSWKATNKIFMYLWAPFIVQNSKKHFQSQFRVSRMFHFWVRNDPFALNTFVLVQTIIITIIYLLALFSVQNFKKNSSSSSRVMRTHHFWIQNGLFAPNKFFFWEKVMNIIFIYLLAPFIVKNFKKFLQRIQSYEDTPFFGP